MGIFVDPSITNHLRKYFDLACSHFQEGDLGLAVFFAITLIEECAKILYLRDANIEDKKQRQGALNHQEKHLTALINLVHASERFELLPKESQDSVWSWLGNRQLMQLRNRSLYIWFDKQKGLTIPEQTISHKEAALIVYTSGFAAAELGEYVDLDPAWVHYMLQNIEMFRNKYL